MICSLVCVIFLFILIYLPICFVFCMYKISKDEIVCHPYFLSPGRHVKEDIPKLVQEAIENLNIDNIRVVITDPLGSNTPLMIGAIHSIVQAASSKKTKTNF